MKMFGGGSGPAPESEAQRARDQASIESLEAGGLPLNASDRLREQASRQNTPTHIFSSDLSVNELLLTHQCGFEPLGQVMGTSMYHVGFVYTPGYSWVSGEMATLTQAYYEARHLAMGRLLREAKLLHADGVVGVRLTRTEYEWGSGMIEFMALGTAVRRIGAPPLPENENPFVSALNGQDHYALRQEGMKPVGFCMGNCTWYQIPDWRTQVATGWGSWYNQELIAFTQGSYTARELAMTRMEMEAKAVGAIGIVGVEIETSVQTIDVNNQINAIMHFSATGTAIRPDTYPVKDERPKPILPIGG